MKPAIARGLVVLGVYVVLSLFVHAGGDFGVGKLLLGPTQSAEPASLFIHGKIQCPGT